VKDDAAITRRDFVATAALGVASLSLASCERRTKALAVTPGADAIQRLRASLGGHIVLPGDSAYDNARRVAWRNPATDKHPALLAVCARDSDVARCIEFARRHEMKLAVRSGGHSFMGWGVGDGLVIDVSRMKEMTVDPVGRRIRVGAGVTAEEMLRSAAPHGLAPNLGECGSVGAGLGLGGGLGWLSGSHGATCDSLLSARLVTAGSDFVSTEGSSNADLDWAVRGGGGNFGVVTSFDYQLHPVREVLAGGFAYDVVDARVVIRGFQDFMSTAPDELQALVYLNGGRSPSLMVVLVYAGDVSAGERVINSFRKLRARRRDWVQRRLYADVYTMPPYSDDNGPGCAFHAIRGSYIEHLSHDAIDVLLERFSNPPPACDFGFDLDHYMHGRVCRVAPQSTAFELRAPGAVHLAFGAEWDAPERAAACGAWLDETWRQLQPFAGGRMYTNYMSVDGDAPAKAAYGRNYARLASIKRRYDPENVFAGNLNIRPA
jgi:FAD/FMN-containing dehydrogenase